MNMSVPTTFTNNADNDCGIFHSDYSLATQSESAEFLNKMETKKCVQCNIEKTLNNFTKQKSGKQGVAIRCIDCVSNNWWIKYPNIPVESLEGEIWVNVKNYEGIYMVSNKGRVKALERFTLHRGKMIRMREMLMSQYTTDNGYMALRLCGKGDRTTTKHFLVHDLVGFSFLENPENKSDINHIDGIKNHNWVENLEWNTRSENILHSYKIGLRGKRKAARKPIMPLLRISPNDEIKRYSSIKEAMRDVFTYPSINRCCNGETESYKKFKWKYA